MKGAKCDKFLCWINGPKRLHTRSLLNSYEFCFKGTFFPLRANRVEEFTRTISTMKRKWPFTIYTTWTCRCRNPSFGKLCQFHPLLSHRACKWLISFYHHPKLCQECGQKKRIFLLLSWQADNIAPLDKVMFLVPVEFSWLDFMGLDFIYIKWNAFPIFHQCTNANHIFFVQNPCCKRKRCVQLV